MSKHVADNFIAELSMTLKTYQGKSQTSQELDELMDMSGHLIDALGAVRATQVTRSDGGHSSATAG